MDFSVPHLEIHNCYSYCRHFRGSGKRHDAGFNFGGNVSVSVKYVQEGSSAYSCCTLADHQIMEIERWVTDLMIFSSIHFWPSS